MVISELNWIMVAVLVPIGAGLAYWLSKRDQSL